LGGWPVTSTSTRIPGSTKPAMPVTSFTRTVTARIPTGMTGRQTDSAAARRQPSLEHRLVHQDVADQRAIDHFLGLGESAFGEGRAGSCRA
jgi:hypothetical protein